MATTGSITVAMTAYDDLVFTWTLKSQNVASNASVVDWTLKLVAGSNGRISSSYAKNWTVTVNGTEYSGTNYIDIANNETKTLASGSTTITHNSDGTKTFSFSFYQQVKITFSGVYISSKEGSGSGTLTTIARSTTPTVSSSSVDMGSAVTINTPRAASSFTHDLAYSFAGADYVNIATGVGTSYKWTTPDLASKIPSATSGTVTIRCITKNGSTTIGTKTVTMTLKVPASVVPTISAVSVAEAVAGIAAQFGAYIQNRSRLDVNITAAGAKGSTIKTYSSTLLGRTYGGSSWTSGLLTSSGSLAIVTTVTDSRGRTASKTTTITVQAYSGPVITALQVCRVNANGDADQEGEYIAVKYQYSVASLGGKNTASMVVEYKQSTATEWLPLLMGYDLSADTTKKPTGTTFSTDYQYDVRMSVIDWFDGAATYIAQLPTAAVILDILADGTGMSFGKVAEISNLLDIAWTVRLQGGELPVFLEDGVDLNNVRTPGSYTGKNVSTYNYGNCPITGGTFDLQVESCGDAGQIKQTFSSCSKYNPKKFTRFYYQGTWGSWLWASTDEVTLYESASGSADTITLTYGAGHFRYLEIYYTDNNGKTGGYTKVFGPHGKTVSLDLVEGSASMLIRKTLYTISDTTITPDVEAAGYIQFSGTANSIVKNVVGANYLKIVRVIGRA